MIFYIKSLCRPRAGMAKTLLVMKLIVLLLTTTILQVSASSYGQNVTLKQNNARLTTVLDEIRRQTGYDFFYSEKIMKDSKPVNVDLKNVGLLKALDICFEDQPLTYSIENRAVTIKAKIPSFLDQIINRFADIIVSGIIRDEKGEALPGATIKIKESNVSTTANSAGRFSISVPDRNAVLIVSFIGYKTKEIKIPKDGSASLEISLDVDVSQLQAVNVVSTGYQTLPKERATGSFEKISNGLFNRTTGTDILSRLNGTVAGLYFNTKSAVTTRGFSLLDNASIRGLSSLSVVKPLLILDNLPYEGDPNNINPNDIQDVTILKDAAAASIWGARAGNGVIVMTTKKGVYDKPLQISFNSNITVVKKPDLFYINKISSSDFIDVEKFLFSKGNYTSSLGITDPYPPFFTPVVELLAKQESLPVSDLQGRTQIDNQINELRNYDIRNDFNKYIYRNATNQQYALSLNGGGKQISYLLGAGYDNNLNNLINSSYNRLNLRMDVRLKPIKNLEIQTGLLYTNNRSREGGSENSLVYNSGFLSNVYPYARMADDSGSPLAIGKNYRTNYLDNLSNNPNLLDWRYKPLVDLHESKSELKLQDLLFNLGSNYQFNDVFSLDLKYQYENANSNSGELYRPNSFLVRDLVNLYTDPTTYTRSIPTGSIYRPGTVNSTSQTFRGQLNINKDWDEKHSINLIFGAEARKIDNVMRSDWYYGYNENTGSFVNVDVVNSDKPYFYGGETSIPYSASIDKTANRYTSIFANTAYIYSKRYMISASARKDAANVLGNNSNKRGAPLWSAGAAWTISNENFYKFDFIPYLKLRTTYGYSGNVNNSVFAFPVITYQSPLSTTNLPYATMAGLANPDLRWEKVGMLNAGLDFAFKDNRVSGSIEYYDKKSSDVIANAPIDPTKGATFQTFNTANIHVTGIDLTLNSINLSKESFRWNTTFIFSYNQNIVTKYLLKPTNPNLKISGSNSINPVEGKNAYAVFGYKWAGLDPDTGDPRGYLNGQVSKDYVNLNRTPVSDFRYFGSSVPLYFGSFRNSITYGGLTLSANILYKFDYYFRRIDGINYGSLFFGNLGTAEFADRWQKSGDETRTNVPSMLYPNPAGRDTFYNNSEVMIEKGDHIRLQDITADYTFRKINGLRDIRVYANISNIGILWRANNKGIDPDITSGYRRPFAMAFGLNANF